MQARHPSYKESVIRRGAPLFTGEMRRYAVQHLTARLISLPTRLNLTRQWMLVITLVNLRLPLNMEPARRAHNRRRTCVLQSQGLYFSRFSWNRIGQHRRTRNFAGIYSTQMWEEAITRQITCDMVRTFECLRLRRLTTIFWGTASQWTTNDRSSTWDFTRTSVRTRMVRRYEHSWLCLTHHFEVPVIVVFTKYEQFLCNIDMYLFDFPNEYPDSDATEVVERLFQERYLHPLGDNITFVRLKSEFRIKWQEYMLMFWGRNAPAK